MTCERKADDTLTDLQGHMRDEDWIRPGHTLLVPRVPFEVVKSGLKGTPALMLAWTKRGLPCQV